MIESDQISVGLLPLCREVKQEIPESVIDCRSGSMECLARDPVHVFGIEAAGQVEPHDATIEKEVAPALPEHQSGGIVIGCLAVEAEWIAKILRMHAPPVHTAAENPDDHFSASSSAMYTQLAVFKYRSGSWSRWLFRKQVARCCVICFFLWIRPTSIWPSSRIIRAYP